MQLGITAFFLAVDGTTFRAQYSPNNKAEFGFISKTLLVYPQLRIVSLHSTQTRMLLGAAVDGCNVGETTFINLECSPQTKHVPIQ